MTMTLALPVIVQAQARAWPKLPDEAARIIRCGTFCATQSAARNLKLPVNWNVSIARMTRTPRRRARLAGSWSKVGFGRALRAALGRPGRRWPGRMVQTVPSSASLSTPPRSSRRGLAEAYATRCVRETCSTFRTLARGVCARQFDSSGRPRCAERIQAWKLLESLTRYRVVCKNPVNNCTRGKPARGPSDQRKVVGWSRRSICRNTDRGRDLISPRSISTWRCT